MYTEKGCILEISNMLKPYCYILQQVTHIYICTIYIYMHTNTYKHILAHIHIHVNNYMHAYTKYYAAHIYIHMHKHYYKSPSP